MLHLHSYRNIKIIAVLLLMIMMVVGCGGGRATTTSEAVSSNSNPEIPPAQSGPGSATLSWSAPTAYVDDTVITELGGHIVYIDNGNGYTKLVSIDNPSVSTYIVENLLPGTYSFVVTAFDSNGVESSYSSVASITISS